MEKPSEIGGDGGMEGRMHAWREGGRERGRREGERDDWGGGGGITSSESEPST